MDYHSKFEFDKEMKENLNTENIPTNKVIDLDSYVDPSGNYP